MTLNRRQWLQGITCAGGLATLGKTSSFAAKSRNFSPETAVRMPRPLGSPVTESLRPVIETSRDVHTHYEKIVEVAGWMAYEDLPMPNLAIPYGLEKTPDIAMDFVMVGNTIDTAFTDFKTHVKFQTDYAGAHLSDSDAMFGCLKRALDKGMPVLDGKFLASITRQDMQKIFAGNIEMPMLDEKIAVFRQAGEVLTAKYGGRYYNFIRSCPPRLYDNGKGLVEKLAAEFPRYNDVSMYDGHEIKFYKLTQLGFWQIYSGLHETGAFKLEDPQKMTAFADYIVPVALRLMGMTSYSPALEQAINSHQLIPRDSRQEIEIRAHCLYATALLTDEINKLRKPDEQIIIPQIDARLWTHYHTTSWPHHLTETIMY
ncbi:MAG TPA: queuosine salvage family protein [Candidatus Sulfotelmatobacter sp.]|nr:queuosine salvage family protein [Candidatus Sulfotelmatobacter sp.]